MLKNQHELSELFFSRPFVFITIIGALLCVSPALIAQSNLDVCRVTTHTRSLKEGIGTGIDEVGKFPVSDIVEITKKNFRYETAGKIYTVEVEVEYGDVKDVEKGKPTNINLTLLARLSGDKSTESVTGSVEAGTSYRYKWGTVYVSSDIIFGDIAQHFRLTCSDGISKGGVQRGEPTWVKKSKT